MKIKSILSTLSVFVLIVLAFACSSSDDGEASANSITVTTNSTSVFEGQSVTFTVKDNLGTNVTANSNFTIAGNAIVTNILSLRHVMLDLLFTWAINVQLEILWVVRFCVTLFVASGRPEIMTKLITFYHHILENWVYEGYPLMGLFWCIKNFPVSLDRINFPISNVTYSEVIEFFHKIIDRSIEYSIIHSFKVCLLFEFWCP